MSVSDRGFPGGAPSSSSRTSARRFAASRSLAAKTFIVSRVPHPLPPGQGSGPWPGGLQRAPTASAGCAALRAP